MQIYNSSGHRAINLLMNLLAQRLSNVGRGLSSRPVLERFSRPPCMENLQTTGRLYRLETPNITITREHYINPPSTTLPTLATSVFKPVRLESSNSLTTPWMMILRTLLSALVKSSATTLVDSRGEGTRVSSRV